jgi:hypothetical protein
MARLAIIAAVSLFYGAVMADDFRSIINEVFMNMGNTKTIEILCRSTPTDPFFGYADPVRVFDGTELIGIYDGSSCPNGFKIIEEKDLALYKPHTILRNVKIEGAIYPYVVMWDSTYGKISCGKYSGKVQRHAKYGKCILLHNGDAVSAIMPRRKYNWKFQMKEIFIHCGDKDTLNGDAIDWRGSAGCITVRTSQWKNFMSNFKDDEEVNIIIRQDGNE